MPAFWDTPTSPELIGRRVIEDIFTRDDFMMYDYNNSIAVHYAEVCTGFGAARLAGLLKDSSILSRLSERYMKVITDNIPNTANHVDVNVYGILALELYTQTKNQIFLKQGLELADIQWEYPLPNGMTKQTRFWVDDIWMIGSLQVQAYRVTANPVYLERAALELDAYVRRLQQPNGLYFHGEDGLFYWGRGNGWAAAGLAELLSELPEENPHHVSILDGYRRMMNALLRYQSEDGMWRQLVDHEEAWKETSSTGMFGYGMAMGVKAGILPQEDFTAAYQKAWLALTKYVTDEGKVTEVCVGTGQGQSVEYYLERPRVTGDFHGQAPVLWFAHCLLTMQGPKTIAFLFEKEPATWGLRGDPHLWREMQDYFAETPTPATSNELVALIETTFESLTGHSINESDTFYVERFEHGGMSSGFISPEFWREKVMPMIRERFDAFPK